MVSLFCGEMFCSTKCTSPIGIFRDHKMSRGLRLQPNNPRDHDRIRANEIKVRLPFFSSVGAIAVVVNV